MMPANEKQPNFQDYGCCLWWQNRCGSHQLPFGLGTWNQGFWWSPFQPRTFDRM